MENCACSRATFQYGVWVVWGGAISFKLLVDSSDATLHHGLGFCVGWRGAITFKFCAHLSDAKLRHGLGFWVGWGGAITFNLLAHSTDTTLRLRKKNPRVSCQVFGPPGNIGLLIFTCFNEIEFGNGHGTLEIPRAT